MRNANFIICCGIIILILSSCKNKSTNYNQKKALIINFDEAIYVDTFRFSNFVKDYHMVQLETTPNSIFSSTSEISPFEDGYLVLDQKQGKLFEFSPTGKFLCKICPPGKGMGKFDNITDFGYDKLTRWIYVLDLRLNNLLYFDINGIFQDKLSFLNQPSAVEVINGSAFFLVGGKLARNNNFSSLFSINYNSRKTKHYLPREESFVNKIESPKFWVFGKFGDTLYYWEDFYDYIYMLNDNHLSPKYLLKFNSNQYAKSELQSDEIYSKNWSKKNVIIRFCLTDKLIFFRVSRSTKSFFYIYDKISNRLFESKAGLFNDIDFSPPFWPKSTGEGNTAYCLIDYFELRQYNHYLKSTNTDIEKIMDHSKLNGNPLLYKVSFR